LRPPFAQERLRLRSDGRVALELKMAWRDGTREFVFEPLEFLERLAALTPRPETNVLICHGVLAPRARWRTRVVVYGRRMPEPTASAAPLAAGPEDTKVKSSPRVWSWAALMHRAFGIDVLACAHCGGRLRLVAVHDPAVIRKILAHLALSHSGQSPGPAPPSPAPPRPDRIGSGARRKPSCLRRGTAFAVMRPVLRPILRPILRPMLLTSEMSARV
jgi:hypothetical protein